MSNLEQAEARFKAAQKALEDFLQEHTQFTIDGQEFISERNRFALSRQLDALRMEHAESGAAWAAALPVPVPQ